MRVLLTVAALALVNVHAVPQGFVTFFSTDRCPAGWTEVPQLKGRLIVSVTNPAVAGVAVNTPLKDQEERTHTHSWNTFVDLPQKQVAAIGCCNNQGAAHDKYPVSGNFDDTPSGYPMTQMVACRLSQPNNDPVAFGTVGFFDASVVACPPDWEPFSEGNGRIVVPGYRNGGPQPSVAPPLVSGEDRQHRHYYNASFKTVEVSYEGIAGCCNNGPAASGTVRIQDVAQSTSTGLPYLQMLTCVSEVETFNTTLPQGALAFNSLKCPTGWVLDMAHRGRMLVANPDGGEAGASFGGRSLGADAAVEPHHLHTFKGSFATRSTGVGLASGCCGHGYVADQEYTFDGVSSDVATRLPYVMVPLCTRATETIA